MRFAFTDEQLELRRSARRFLDQHAPLPRVRAAMQTERGWDPELWLRIGELGWPALIVPEDYGGLGFGAVELAALVEELGRALLCAPLFSTVCLATHALVHAGADDHKRAYLPRIAAGELTATVALTDGDSPARARRAGDGYALTGTKRFVIDGHTAELLLVAAELDGERALFAVDAAAPGVARTWLPTMDQTRKQAAVELRDARADRLPGAWSDVEHALRLAWIALAAEQVGGAEACLAMAVDYAKTRHQFGRPIGSFQAIKHKCADMLLRVESARSAAYGVACLADAGDPELPALASAARAYCSDAFFRCAAENIQIHGGIGFTWEHDAHLYFKRARASAALFGDAAHHRERVAQELGL